MALSSQVNDATTGPQYLAKFFTKQKKYAVPDHPFSLPVSATPQELNSFINTLLSETKEEDEDSEKKHSVDFDFLISNELLKLSLKEHLDSRKIESNENVIEIEFIERVPAPTPFETLEHDDWVSGVRCSEKWILSACYDNTVHLWNTKGEHLLTIPGHTDPVTSIAWINVGDELCTFASASHDETACIWQWNCCTNAVECMYVCKGHSRSVNCIDVNKQHTKLATGSFDCTLRIWSTEGGEDQTSDQSGSGGNNIHNKKAKMETGGTKQPLATMTGHKSSITGVKWMGDGETMICTSSMDDTIKIWDVENGGLKTQLIGSKAFLGVSYSPLSTLLLTASADRFIRLWDPRSKEGSLVKCVYSSHTHWVTSVCWCPFNEHLFVSGSHDMLVKLWDSRSCKAPLYDMIGHNDRVLCVDWSVPGFIASGGCDNQVKIFEQGTS